FTDVYWFDPERGYNCVRRQKTSHHPKLFIEATEEREYELDDTGAWLLKTFQVDWVENGVVGRRAVVVDEVRGGELSLSAEMFTVESLNIPPDTRTEDYRFSPRRELRYGDLPTEAEIRQLVALDGGKPGAARVGDDAPELVFEEAADVTLGQFRGKPVVLAFVSVYSRPCVKVLEELKALQEQKGEGSLTVIAVHDRTATPEEIEQFRRDHGIPFPIARVPDAPRDGWASATFRAYGVTAVPTVVFIDGKGKVVSAGDLNGLLEGAARSLAGWKSDSDEAGRQMVAWTKKRAALEAHFAGVAELDKERQKKWDLDNAEVRKMSSHDLCAHFLETPCGVAFDMYDDPNIGVERVRRSINVLRELLDRADAVEAIGQYYAEYPFEAAVESAEGRASTTPPYRCVTLLKFPPLLEKTRGREPQLLVALAEGDARIRRMMVKHGDASPFGLRSRFHAAELAETLWGQYDHDGYDKWQLQRGTTAVFMEDWGGLAVYIDSLYREIVRVLPKKDPSSSSTLSATSQGS
ncbi:unnamed protein product, partial [marine sediment metagenome]